MPNASTAKTQPSINLGLVCITHSEQIRYKALTRTRYLALDHAAQERTLRLLYQYNLEMLFMALEFCHHSDIALYRMLSEIFPLSDFDDGIGREVLKEMAERMAQVGPTAKRFGIRVIAHPDQFVVLNSEKPQVIENSISILENHAFIFDAFGLPQSTWACLNIHGGKGGRSRELVEEIGRLSDGVRLRLTLENDERAYGAAEILEVCQAAGVPMTFDAHHHLVKEKLDNYEDKSIAEFVALARATWTPPEWQVLHISNGRETLHDNRHHDLVEILPSVYHEAQWIEVEAKSKEVAIAHLQRHWL
jgi:UV DNA damage endonuclease